MLQEHLENFVTGLTEGLQKLDRRSVWQVIAALMEAWRAGRQVFIVGNGGSAATASHMANDLGKLVVPGQPRFRAIALTDNVSLMTAWANDVAYERIFAEQLLNLCQKDDLLIAISCSGNSPNVLRCVEAARTLGARVIALTGDQGGCLKSMADVCVFAPAPDIGQQEDIHLALNHMIGSTLRKWITAIATRAAQSPRAVVLAAGEGSRLRPLTLDRPKPMLPINGKPLLQYTLEWLRRYGVQDVAINLHYQPEVIVKHFGDGADLGLRIIYSHEDPILGTAGAVRKLEHFAGDTPVVVVYGDVLTDLDLQALLSFHHQAVAHDPRAGVTLSLYRVPNPTEVGLVELDPTGRITRFVEKPKPDEVFTDLASAGVLVLEPQVISQIPEETFYDFGRDLFPRLLELDIPIYGWAIPDQTYLVDIGTPANYARAQHQWPLYHRESVEVKQ
jgi:phosphoheptose isomerase/UTP-glucose-1-phosphate uridylyltransferase